MAVPIANPINECCGEQIETDCCPLPLPATLNCAAMLFCEGAAIPGCNGSIDFPVTYNEAHSRWEGVGAFDFAGCGTTVAVRLRCAGNCAENLVLEHDNCDDDWTEVLPVQRDCESALLLEYHGSAALKCCGSDSRGEVTYFFTE